MYFLSLSRVQSIASLKSVYLKTSLKYICLFTHSGSESQGFSSVLFNIFVTLNQISRQNDFQIWQIKFYGQLFFLERWRIFLRNPLIRLSATFSLSEKAKNELVASHQKDQIYKSNQRLKNPHPVVDRWVRKALKNPRPVWRRGIISDDGWGIWLFS